MDLVGSNVCCFDPPSASGGGAAVPIVVRTGVTFAVADNTQVSFAHPLVVEAGGVILTEGTGVLVGV